MFSPVFSGGDSPVTFMRVGSIWFMRSRLSWAESLFPTRGDNREDHLMHPLLKIDLDVENLPRVEFLKHLKADVSVPGLVHALPLGNQVLDTFLPYDPAEFLEAQVLTQRYLGLPDELIINAVPQAQVREVFIDDPIGKHHGYPDLIPPPQVDLNPLGILTTGGESRIEGGLQPIEIDARRISLHVAEDLGGHKGYFGHGGQRNRGETEDCKHHKN